MNPTETDIRARKPQMQSDLDREQSATYEQYGPHFHKILRNQLEPYRDTHGKKLLIN